MGAANGFVTVSPDARYGASAGTVSATETSACRFALGSTGTKQITEIGLYIQAVSGTVACKIAIFENDAANTCPGAMIANSEATLSASSGAYTKTYATYGTKPQVTGGVTYWIALIQEGSVAYSRIDTGGVNAYKSGLTTYTWPAEAAWHTKTDYGRDWSYYAVYEDAASGVSLPILMNSYRQRRN
jgi:hypothetical protein